MRSASELTPDEFLKLVKSEIDAHAEVSFEQLSPVRFVAYITSSTFEGVDEGDRQRRVWNVVRETFDYAEHEPLALILTITPAEEAAIGTDRDTVFDHRVDEPAS